MSWIQCSAQHGWWAKFTTHNQVVRHRFWQCPSALKWPRCTRVLVLPTSRCSETCRALSPFGSAYIRGPVTLAHMMVPGQIGSYDTKHNLNKTLANNKPFQASWNGTLYYGSIRPTFRNEMRLVCYGLAIRSGYGQSSTITTLLANSSVFSFFNQPLTNIINCFELPRQLV